MRTSCTHRGVKGVPKRFTALQHPNRDARRKADFILRAEARRRSGRDPSGSRQYSMAAEQVAGPGPAEPAHVVLLVNGLFGHPGNWRIVLDSLSEELDSSKYVLLVSNSNQGKQTFYGISECGERLATEVLFFIRARPSLRMLSIIAHSMGGLVARYALGRLFNERTQLIAGLRPVHFISMATPHLGCDSSGPSQVPFFGWAGEWPLIGSYVLSLLKLVGPRMAGLLFDQTGLQFFLLDGTTSDPPLLVQLAGSNPKYGPFLAALRAFASRTCYANSSGDHLVGWANASVRHPSELPVKELGVKHRGVFREDPLHAASSQESKGGGQRIELTAASQAGVQAAEAAVHADSHALKILDALQSLPWCRIDVCFSGARMPFSHNHIQVTRVYLNWEGRDVVQHLARHFTALEREAGSLTS